MSTIQKTDANFDKISDFSSALIARKDKVDDIIVMLQKESTRSVLDKIRSLGFEVTRSWENLDTLAVRGNFKQIDSLLGLNEVLLVEEVQPLRAHLYYSAVQMQVRPMVWDLGYMGSPDTSIAILDTGIDPSHPMFQGKILKWKDFVGERVDVSNDLYSSPVDFAGHGSHVAGIAAGMGTNSTLLEESNYGNLPASGYRGVVASIPYHSTPVTVTLGVDWGNKGRDNGLNPISFMITTTDDLNTIIASKNTDSSGLDEVSIPLPAGKYFVWIAGGSSNGYYDFWMKVKPNDSLPSSSDGYPVVQGIAPKSKIVAVKVLDDNGDGDSLTFLDAINWILTVKDQYNISVMNLSFGTDVVISSLDSAIDTLADSGIVPVISAGNDGPTATRIGSPGSAKKAITVGAVNRFNEITYYSSKGNSLDNPGVKPDIVAPGGSYLIPAFGAEGSYTDGYGTIYSADTNSRGYQAQDNDYIGYQGTSMSSPHIAGLALLLVQKMKELGIWNGDLASVLQVKNAILAGAAEVANIGYGGGERYNGEVDPSPSIQRDGKDYYEGWGLVNAYASLSYFDRYVPINFPVSLTFGFEDPFLPNSYLYRLQGGTGKQYDISLDVPSDADLDILVFSVDNPKPSGDPYVLFSSINAGLGVSESMSISLSSDADVVLAVRVVDASSAVVSANLTVSTPIVPTMTIHSPVPFNYYANLGLLLNFSSTTGFGEVFLNGTSLGVHHTGDRIDLNVTSGAYNLTIVERDIYSGDTASDTAIVFIDSSPPQIISTNLGEPFTGDFFNVTFSVTDNLAVQKVELFVGDTLVASTTNSSGEFRVNLSNIPFGNNSVSLTATDFVGLSTSVSTWIKFNHSIYVADLEELTLEGRETVEFTWEAGSYKPSRYELYANGTEIDSGVWDGGSIPVRFSPPLTDGLPVWNLTLTVFTNDSLSLSQSLILHLVDTSPPVITITGDSVVDLTSGPFEVTVDVWDFTLSSITHTFPDNAVMKEKSSTITQREFHAVYEITADVVGISVTIDFTANDSLGLESLANYKVLVSDLTPPEILPHGDETTNEGEDYTITWKINEKFVKSIELKERDLGVLDVATFLQNGEYSYNTKDLPAGTYTLTLTVKDQGDNLDSQSINLVVIGTSSTGTQGSSTATSSDLLPFSTLAMLGAVFSTAVVFRRRLKL